MRRTTWIIAFDLCTTFFFLICSKCFHNYSTYNLPTNFLNLQLQLSSNPSTMRAKLLEFSTLPPTTCYCCLYSTCFLPIYNWSKNYHLVFQKFKNSKNPSSILTCKSKSYIFLIQSVPLSPSSSRESVTTTPTSSSNIQQTAWLISSAGSFPHQAADYPLSGFHLSSSSILVLNHFFQKMRRWHANLETSLSKNCGNVTPAYFWTPHTPFNKPVLI